MTKGIGTLAAAILALATSAACTVQQADSAPPLTGPSGFFQDITVTATPDVITRDGFSQSAIVVRVFGPNGQPVSAVPLRVDILDSTGIPVDFGTLSTKQIVTGTDGRATTVYTAPPPPPPTAGGTTTFATIRAIALGNDALNSKSFTAEIRLVPPGVILPPAGTPTAAFTFSPQPAAANLQLQFDASTSQPGTGASQIVSYNWTFGDGSSATGKTPTHTFTAANIYNVTLTVTNDRGLSASTTVPVNVVAGALPTPTFTVSPSAPAVGVSVFFNASTATAGPGHSIAAYRWAFGDGATGSGVSTSHAYTIAGTYTVQLTVTDDVGLSATSAGTAVTVGNPVAPAANFTFSPSTPAVGESVTFDYRSTILANGQAIVALDWNFGDGTAPVRCPGNAACASDGITTHAFQRTGTFTVALVVTDAAGRIGTKSTTVTVTAGGAATLPTARFTSSPTSPSVNQSVFFNASSSTPSPGRTLATYAWDFGDGTPGGTGVTPTHAYVIAGGFTVTLIVTDDRGQTGTFSAGVLVVPAAGGGGGTAAVFTFSPTNPVVNQLVAFNASGSTAASGRTITTYAWDFGDLSCPGATNCTATTTTTASTSHQFASTGTFSVLLTVTDSAGQTGRFSAPVTVASASTGDLLPDFSVSPTDPVSGQLVSFNANLSTAGGGASITSYDWDFGDGTVVNGQSSFLINHTYFTPIVPGNTFTIRLTVHDTLGRSATKTRTLLVLTGSDPTAIFTVSPSPATVGATVTFDGSNSSAVLPKTIARYTWDFGDGSQIVSTTPPTAMTTHSYAATGTYVIRLTVTDSNGLSSSTTRTLLVQ